MSITLSALQRQRRDTAANWTAEDPTLLAGEIGLESDTGYWKVGDGATAWTSLAYVSGLGAEIPVDRLADGAARQLLQTDAAGTGVEWTDNVDVPGTLDVTGAGTFDGNVTIAGDLTVNGTTTTINTQDLLVEDKNIIIGNVTTPSDVTADGGGITLKGTTDKTINWVDSTDAWTLSEHVNIASGKEYRIDGTKVLDATSLGSAVVSSSLTSVGILTGLTTSGDVTLNAQADLRFADSDSSNWVALQAPATVASNVTWTLPDADGTSGQVLSTDGAGALSWATAATDKIEEGNSSVEVIDTGSDGRVVFTTQGNEVGRFDSSGRLGLGTSSPGSYYADAGNLVVATSGATGITIASGTTNYGYLCFADGTTGDAPYRGYLEYAHQIDRLAIATAGTQRLIIDSSGRVGVGTTPAVPFHLVGNIANFGVGRIQNTNASGYSAFEIFDSTGAQKGAFGYANASASVTSGNSYIYASGDLALLTGGTSERARIDSSGRLLVGTSSSRSVQGDHTPQIQLEGTGYASSTVSVIANSNDANGSYLFLGKSRGTTVGSNTIVQNGDSLGQIRFLGSDGVGDFVQGANIEAVVDGTPGSNDLPSRLVFSTTADGASSPTERMRISNGGDTKFYRNTSVSGNFILYAHSDFGSTDNLRFAFRADGGFANYQANNLNLSDRNAKKDISPAADTWDCIKEWEIVNYRYKDQPDDADLNLGVIAQQVAESCPEVIIVFEEAKDDQPERLGVKEQQMYWMAIKALQEAQVRIEQLETTNTDLLARVTALEAA